MRFRRSKLICILNDGPAIRFEWPGFFFLAESGYPPSVAETYLEDRDSWTNATGAFYACAALVASAIVILHFQGRVWWCQMGDALPWSWEVWSPHNSQHVIDPYSFTHVLHGVLEFWLHR